MVGMKHKIVAIYDLRFEKSDLKFIRKSSFIQL